MPKYAIIDSFQKDDGSFVYDVIFKADDGYEETQRYINGEDVDAIVEATKHFNSERMALVAQQAEEQAPPPPPVFIDVAP